MREGVQKICSKFTGERPCRIEISMKLLCNFIEITLRHGRFLVNLLHIFRTPFPENTSGGLLLTYGLTEISETTKSLWSIGLLVVFYSSAYFTFQFMFVSLFLLFLNSENLIPISSLASHFHTFTCL